MLGFLLLLLTVWLSAAFVGALGNGLFWLTVAVLPLLLTTGAMAEAYTARRHREGSPAGSTRSTTPAG